MNNMTHFFSNSPSKFLPTFLLSISLLLIPTPSTAAETIASGSWTNKSYDIHGAWKIVARDGASDSQSDNQYFIVFDDDFKTRKGPDLKVYLSEHSFAAVTDDTVTSGSIEIAALKSARGAQEYAIPTHLNLADFRSLLIHCKKYAHLWGGAEIAR